MVRLNCRALAATLLLALAAGAVRAQCPDAEEIVRRIEALDLERTSRATRFTAETPSTLYRKAARRLERPFVDRKNRKGFGVLVTELPLEQWWQAINDENSHGEYVPVGHSEVLGGAVRGDQRIVFQWATMFGIGRWWLSRIRMNAELFESTRGALWEFWWEGDLDAYDRDRPPISDVSGRHPPMETTRGSWLLGALGDGCTLVELFSWSRAGGAVGMFEGVATTRSLKATLNGMHRFADRLDPEVPLLEPPFIRPDGTPLPLREASRGSE